MQSLISPLEVPIAPTQTGLSQLHADDVVVEVETSLVIYGITTYYSIYDTTHVPQPL
jgi:hypothetical protein